MPKKNIFFYTTIFLNNVKGHWECWYVNLYVSSNIRFQNFFKSEQIELHSSFFEPVNLELSLAVFNFLPIFSLICSWFLKNFRVAMSILAAMFVKMFNSYCSVCLSEGFFPAFPHRKTAKEKSKLFWREQLPKISQLLAQSNSAL